MDTKKRPQYVVLEQPIFRIVDTLIEISGYVSLLFINHLFLGGNGWLDVVFIFLILILIGGIQNGRAVRFKNKAELKKWLDK